MGTSRSWFKSCSTRTNIGLASVALGSQAPRGSFVCGSIGPPEGLKGQVATSGPNSSRKIACTTVSRVERSPTSASPPAELTGAAATIAGSTAGRMPVRIPPSEMPKTKVSPPGLTSFDLKITQLPLLLPCGMLHWSPPGHKTGGMLDGLQVIGLAEGGTSKGKEAGPPMSGMPSPLKSPAASTCPPWTILPVPSNERSTRTSCIQSTIDCRTASRVWKVSAVQKSPPGSLTPS